MKTTFNAVDSMAAARARRVTQTTGDPVEPVLPVRVEHIGPARKQRARLIAV